VVRDPVAVTVSAPRFLTLGDETQLDIAVHNVEGAAGSYSLAATTEGAAPEMREIALAVSERKSDRIALKPTDVGTKTYAVEVTGPGDIKVKRQLAYRASHPRVNSPSRPIWSPT
jgi:alpha-2-macroglobulin